MHHVYIGGQSACNKCILSHGSSEKIVPPCRRWLALRARPLIPCWPGSPGSPAGPRASALFVFRRESMNMKSTKRIERQDTKKQVEFLKARHGRS